MNADGSGQTQLTDAPNIGGQNPSWPPDGRKIVFDSDREEAGNLDVWVMNADGFGQAMAAPGRDTASVDRKGDRTIRVERRVTA